MILLGVNIDHCATVRQARYRGYASTVGGAVEPDPVFLATLAERNSVDSFYRGDIAQQMADAFKKNGGLVTADDLAAYRAREVEPVALSWRLNDPANSPGATASPHSREPTAPESRHADSSA